MTTPYDDVPYPSPPRGQTHPLRLSAIAHLLAVPYVPFAQARVLEVGCGDGVNLIGMAIGAKDARFVGIDLASTGIAVGQEIVRGLGLTNVDLRAMDLCAADDLGQFDYVVAHGVYAWTPEPVREGLMRLIGRCLSPHGLAMVSYNTLPGCRVRQAMRDLMLDAAPPGPDPAARLTQAVDQLQTFMVLWRDDDPLQAALKEEGARMLAERRGVLFHDEFGSVYAPQFLSEVTAHAARHGLDYLADLNPIQATGERPGALETQAGGDLVRLEQLMDFARMRRFRQSIFRRSGGSPAAASIDPARLTGLHARATVRRAPGLGEGGSPVFVSENIETIEAPDASMAELLQALGDASPGSLPLADWDVERLGAPLLELLVKGVLFLQTAPFAFERSPGERPVANALARLQVERRELLLYALDHTCVQIEDPMARRFITLLDGGRDRDDLAQAMGAPADQVDRALAQLAALALLEA